MDNIISAEYSEHMQKSFIDYSMSVITARAVPDIRDGLKPVQRRVLYAMDQLGLNHNGPHRKSARIVGETMGKYHPHGDSSIYDTLVVLEQDFKKGMALVDGHGNFGSIEGDGAAAMRYTEAKLKKFTQEVYLQDLDKDVVDFVPNFDEMEREPSVLPVRVPNFLINGSEGIAVGMVTSVPTHNLEEILNAEIALIDDENLDTAAIMDIVKGPDFPTGGIVTNKSELLSIYETGVGKIKLRGKVVFEPGKGKVKDKLVISEIPYTMIGANIGKFMSDIAMLVESKKTTDIVDITDESNKDGIRIVLELKKDCDVEKLKNLLYKKTKLDGTFGVNMLAIVDGRPETLGIKACLLEHIKFLHEINTRKYTTLLNKELENKEIKEGLIEACNIIDLIIEILRGSKNLEMAKRCLIEGDTTDIRFKSEASKAEASTLRFTPKQATAILELRLYRLIGLEINKLQQEYADCIAKIGEYKTILGSRKAMDRVIKKDLANIIKNYKVDRKTVVEDSDEIVYVEEKVVIENIVFVMDRFGYVKLMEESVFDKNAENVLADNKYVIKMPYDDHVCIFTDKGDFHQIKLNKMPILKPKDKGLPIDNFGNFSSMKERVVYLCKEEDLYGNMLLFATKQGMMKLVDPIEFDVSKKTVAATKLSDGDEVLGVFKVDATFDSKDENVIISHSDIVILTDDNYRLRFGVEEIPQKKKAALGVRTIKLSKDAAVKEVRIIAKGEEPEIKTAHRDQRGSKVKG